MLSADTQALILQQYDEHAQTYHDCGKAAEELIKAALLQKNLRVHSVSHRVKERPSLARKLTRPGKTYQELLDITDITGIRIITHFDEEVDQLKELIAELFDIDDNDSIDKRQSLDFNKFGYLSLHFVVSHRAERCAAPYQNLAGRRFEIQIRSILQHAWAEIEHDLGYKAGDDVPDEIRRRFARVAALLELADVEFSAIRLALEKLMKTEKESYEQAAPAPQLAAASEITLDALIHAYQNSPHLRSLDRVVAQVAGARVNSSNVFVLERSIARLAFLGITTIARFEQEAKSQITRVETFARMWMAGDRFATLEIGVGATYLCYMLVGARQDMQLAINYLNQTSTAGSKLREKMAENILALYRKLPPV